MSKSRKSKFDTVDEDEYELSRPKSKSSAKKPSKKVADFSDSEREQESDREDEKRPVRKPRRKQRAETPEPDSPREEPESESAEFGHPCSGCDETFNCKDGKSKTVKGKRLFKCSCAKLKHNGATAYFCSKKCKRDFDQPEEVSDGYESV